MVLAMIGKLAISGRPSWSFSSMRLNSCRRRCDSRASLSSSWPARSPPPVSPYLADFLSPLVPWLPSVIFGVSSFVAGFSLFNLPETRGMALPDTISDLEELYKQNK
nr:organic anion transporter 3-like [Cherax quadricarinatus]